MALKKLKRFLKKSCIAETGKLEKTRYEMYQNNTVVGWLPNFLKRRFLHEFSNFLCRHTNCALDMIRALDMIPALDMIRALDMIKALDMIQALDMIKALDTIRALDTN